MSVISIVILSAIAILVLAFLGVFGRFPDNWEWVGIVLAAGGIAMGTPSFLQMMLGRSHLLVEFDRIVEKQERALVIWLKNPPVKSKSWRRLGITRNTIQSLTASFRISEFGSKKVLQPIIHATIYPDDDLTERGYARIALPPTYSVSAGIMVARWDNNKQKAVILGDRLRAPLELSAGYYQINIIIIVDGEEQPFGKQFVVGNKADDLVWG